jgi:hypothetical protein
MAILGIVVITLLVIIEITLLAGFQMIVDTIKQIKE